MNQMSNVIVLQEPTKIKIKYGDKIIEVSPNLLLSAIREYESRVRYMREHQINILLDNVHLETYNELLKYFKINRKNRLAREVVFSYLDFVKETGLKIRPQELFTKLTEVFNQRQEVEKLRRENEELKKRIRELEDKVARLKIEYDTVLKQLNDLEVRSKPRRYMIKLNGFEVEIWCNENTFKIISTILENLPNVNEYVITQVLRKLMEKKLIESFNVF